VVHNEIRRKNSIVFLLSPKINPPTKFPVVSTTHDVDPDLCRLPASFRNVCIRHKLDSLARYGAISTQYMGGGYQYKRSGILEDSNILCSVSAPKFFTTFSTSTKNSRCPNVCL